MSYGPPQHSSPPVEITVDHPNRPSQIIRNDDEAVGEPAWLAILDANDDTGKIEAIHVGGPAAAVSLALDILSKRRPRT